MKAWLPGTATYTPFRLPVATAGQNIGLFRRWMMEHATKELGASPSAWRWEREGKYVAVAAAKEVTPL